MSHLRTCSEASLAMTSRGARRRRLGVERLEQRSMLAADGLDELSAVEIDPPALVEPCIAVDTCLVEDLPAAIDPGVFPGGPDPEVLDPEVVVITDPVVDPIICPVFVPGFSDEQQTTWDGDESTIVGDATAEGEDSSLPEGWTLAFCPAPFDLPVLIDEEPVVIVCPGLGDAGDLSEVTFILGDGIDGDATTSPVEAVVDDTADAVPAADTFETVPGAAHDACSEPMLASTASGDDSVAAAFVAAPAAAAPAPSTVAPADAARLFAAYAAGFGQGGADLPVGQSIRGRRGSRR